VAVGAANSRRKKTRSKKNSHEAQTSLGGDKSPANWKSGSRGAKAKPWAAPALSTRHQRAIRKASASKKKEEGREIPSFLYTSAEDWRGKSAASQGAEKKR